jgi:predicted PurR-regulated permease PerM
MNRFKIITPLRVRRTFAVMVAFILAMLLIAGCGPSDPSVLASKASHLIEEYPTLSSLTLSFVEWLIQQYGSDIAALLAAAAAAVVG